MIDERTEELASLYVLDLLSREERAAFEARTRRDPELAQFVRELSASLHAPLKSDLAPSRPDLFEGIRKRVEAGTPGEPKIKKASKAVPRPAGTLPFWATFWALAAGIMLLLNLSLLFLINRGSETHRGGADLVQAANEASGTGRGVLPATEEEARSSLRAEITRLQEVLEARESELSEVRSRGEALTDQIEETKAFNAGWQREYARLAARVLPFFEPNDGMSRFTVIEMVDAEAYARAEPRLGFNELAARYLTGEGNIGGIGTDAFVGPVFEGAGSESEVIQPGQAGLMPIARGDAPPVGGGTEPEADIVQEPPEGSPSGDRPAGFTVWRDDEQKGFLDLYNLPDPVEGEQAYLWVRSGELDPYLPVGELPELENGTGSLFYSIDEENYTPTEILITSEVPGSVGENPSESILLRGP